MANTTNFNWETPDDTDLVKDGAAAIRTLGSAIDTSLVDLKGGTTGQILSKATNTDMDFTWITNDVGDITEVVAGTGLSGGGSSGSVTLTNTVATEFDAKGDLVVGTGADTFDKLTVGANNTILTADSSTATGLKWAAASSGGMTQLATGTLSGASLDLTSISSAYNHLQLIIYGATWGTGADGAKMTINGLTSSNYSYGKNAFRNTTAGNYGTNAVANWDLNDAIANLKNTDGRNHFSFIFYNYSQSAYAPLMKASYTFQSTNDEYSVVDLVGTYAGLSAAINQITFATNSGYTFNGGTYILYGVK